MLPISTVRTCDHTHSCIECRRFFVHKNPECKTLPRGLCDMCEWTWAKRHEWRISDMVHKMKSHKTRIRLVA